MRNVSKLKYALPVLAALVGGAVFYAARDDAGAAAEIRISGNIEATDVELSFRVPGWIEERIASEGETVEAGAAVARLDQTELRQETAMRRAEVAAVAAKLAELEAGPRPEEAARAEAAMAQTQARLAELEAGSRTQDINAARAAVEAATAEQVRAETDYLRLKRLFAQNVVPQRDLDAAEAAYRKTSALVAEARERLRLVEEGPRREQIASARAATEEAGAWRDQVLHGPRLETIEQARAELTRAQEALGLAETRLGYAELRSPVSGVVLSEHVEAGEYVSPGAPVVTVGDLDMVWLRGYLDETDLGRVRIGQRVVVKTDGRPGKAYEGVLAFIASEAEFTPKSVQTDKERVKLVYRVKIDIPNPDGELKPGMPADAYIRVDGDAA